MYLVRSMMQGPRFLSEGSTIRWKLIVVLLVPLHTDIVTSRKAICTAGHDVV
jgi:hypothetical protein